MVSNASVGPKTDMQGVDTIKWRDDGSGESPEMVYNNRAAFDPSVTVYLMGVVVNRS